MCGEYKNVSTVKYIAELKQRIDTALELAAANVSKAQDRMQANYDKAASVRSLNPNDKVLVLMPTSGNRLLSTWAGTYVVHKRLENNNYQILIGNRKSTLHINTLRKFEEANTADGAAAPTTMMIIHE